jgi:hypothetical protein
MTLSIDGTDIGRIIEIASLVGSIVAMLVVGLLVYLMVRPPRHVRQARKAERRGEARTATDPVEAEQMWRMVDRMELRLEVLERALADQVDRPAIGGRETERTLAPVADRDSGRTE